MDLMERGVVAVDYRVGRGNRRRRNQRYLLKLLSANDCAGQTCALADDLHHGGWEVAHPVISCSVVMDTAFPASIRMLLQNRDDVSCFYVEAGQVVVVAVVLQSPNLQSRRRIPQQLLDLSAGLCCSELVDDVQCCLAVGVSHRSIDAAVQQESHCFCLSTQGSFMQGSAGFGLSVDVYTRLDQQPDDVYVSVFGGQVKRRRPIGVSGVSFFGLQQSSAHVAGQQQLDNPNSAELAGQVQGSFSRIVHNTRVGLMLQQHLRHVVVAVLSRQVQGNLPFV